MDSFREDIESRFKAIQARYDDLRSIVVQIDRVSSKSVAMLQRQRISAEEQLNRSLLDFRQSKCRLDGMEVTLKKCAAEMSHRARENERELCQLINKLSGDCERMGAAMFDKCQLMIDNLSTLDSAISASTAKVNTTRAKYKHALEQTEETRRTVVGLEESLRSIKIVFRDIVEELTGAPTEVSDVMSIQEARVFRMHRRAMETRLCTAEKNLLVTDVSNVLYMVLLRVVEDVHANQIIDFSAKLVELERTVQVHREAEQKRKSVKVVDRKTSTTSLTAALASSETKTGDEVAVQTEELSEGSLNKVRFQKSQDQCLQRHDDDKTVTRPPLARISANRLPLCNSGLIPIARCFPTLPDQCSPEYSPVCLPRSLPECLPVLVPEMRSSALVETSEPSEMKSRTVNSDKATFAVNLQPPASGQRNDDQQNISLSLHSIRRELRRAAQGKHGSLKRRKLEERQEPKQ